MNGAPMDITLVVDCLLFLLTTLYATYAIYDTRKQMREVLRLDRLRVYKKVRTDMMWLYIDPTGLLATPELAKGMEDLWTIVQILDPEWTLADLKGAVENEAKFAAQILVENGHAAWKDGLPIVEINEQVRRWESNRNRERIQNLLDEKRKFSLL
jgi:hypothetical protein